MNRFKSCILTLSLFSTAVAATVVPTKTANLRSCYKTTYSKLSNHKGKVCAAAGVVGAGLAYKIFHVEFDSYVKPLIKGVWKKATGWIKRIFRSKKD